MNKIIFLIDNRTSLLEDFWVNKFFVNANYNYLFLGVDNLDRVDIDLKTRMPILHLKYFIASLKCVLKGSKNDLIIIWLDTMGVYAYSVREYFSKEEK